MSKRILEQKKNNDQAPNNNHIQDSTVHSQNHVTKTKHSGKQKKND